MKLRLYFLLFILCNIYIAGQAQSIGSTFRVGLNSSRIIGPSEIGADGSDLEDYTTFTGFHVAGGVVFKLLDHYGFKAEIMYSQKGSRYSYEGPSTYIFNTTRSLNTVTAIGTRTVSQRIINSYIEVPITGYLKYGKFELNAGFTVAVLAGTRAVGDLGFSGTSSINNELVEFTSLINHNYRRDDLERTAVILGFQEQFRQEFTVDGEQVLLLTEETGYAQWTNQNGGVYGKPDLTLNDKLYRGLDFLVNAGVSYYISDGLFFGFTASYGLRDVTNPFFEYSFSESQGLERLERSDKDRNFVLQGSVGFSF